MLLIMGFTGAKALEIKKAYIAEFNRLEELARQACDPQVAARDNAANMWKAISMLAQGGEQNEERLKRAEIYLVQVDKTATTVAQNMRLTPEHSYQLEQAIRRKAREHGNVKMNGILKKELKETFIPHGARSAMKFTDIADSQFAEALQYVETRRL